MTNATESPSESGMDLSAPLDSGRLSIVVAMRRDKRKMKLATYREDTDTPSESAPASSSLLFLKKGSNGQ
jgi:hypothetical protein